MVWPPRLELGPAGSQPAVLPLHHDHHRVGTQCGIQTRVSALRGRDPRSLDESSTGAGSGTRTHNLLGTTELLCHVSFPGSGAAGRSRTCNAREGPGLQPGAASHIRVVSTVIGRGPLDLRPTVCDSLARPTTTSAVGWSHSRYAMVHPAGLEPARDRVRTGCSASELRMDWLRWRELHPR